MKSCNSCPLYRYCITQKREYESCDDMLRKYNARLLLPPQFTELGEDKSNESTSDT